jgi:hypothetical protein
MIIVVPLEEEEVAVDVTDQLANRDRGSRTGDRGGQRRRGRRIIPPLDPFASWPHYGHFMFLQPRRCGRDCDGCVNIASF